MANSLNIAAINGILPKLIEEGQNLIMAQSIFFQEMKKVKETNKINPSGNFIPYTTAENNTAFGVGEGGAILGGGAPEYTLGVANLRAHWSSIVWTGGLERIQSQYLTELRRDSHSQEMGEAKLTRIAQNFAVRDHIMSALKTYARRDNYFALQGTDKSAVGVVTGLPGGNIVQFSWDSTNMGNRLFDKDQQIQFFSPAGVQRVAGLPATASSKFSTVSALVDKTVASGATGPVQFDLLPNAGAGELSVGDTAVFRNSYALMPQGCLHYVDDTGNFNGNPRAINPAIFSSVITRLAGSPAIAPSYIREQLSQMQSKTGYGIPLSLQIWMNKTQHYNWEGQVYSTPFMRFIGPGQVKNLDLSVGELQWDGIKFRIDPDVPPSHVNFINFMAWRKIVQTKMMPYQFDSGSFIINPLNSFGERLDQRQSTIFSEYNWVLDDARSNGRIEGLGFNKIHI